MVVAISFHFSYEIDLMHADRVYMELQFSNVKKKYLQNRLKIFIMKTCLYNFDPHKPHF